MHIDLQDIEIGDIIRVKWGGATYHVKVSEVDNKRISGKFRYWVSYKNKMSEICANGGFPKKYCQYSQLIKGYL